MSEIYFEMFPVSARISSPFRPAHRSDHGGVDFSTVVGTPILAPADGVIKEVRFKGTPVAQVPRKVGEVKSYGKRIVITHSDGWETWYAHLSKILVSPGDEVQMGQTIGLTGNTGFSFGPHLHYETRLNNVQMDPVAVTGVKSVFPGEESTLTPEGFPVSNDLTPPYGGLTRPEAIREGVIKTKEAMRYLTNESTHHPGEWPDLPFTIEGKNLRYGLGQPTMFVLGTGDLDSSADTLVNSDLMRAITPHRVSILDIRKSSADTRGEIIKFLSVANFWYSLGYELCPSIVVITEKSAAPRVTEVLSQPKGFSYYKSSSNIYVRNLVDYVTREDMIHDFIRTYKFKEV